MEAAAIADGGTRCGGGARRDGGSRDSRMEAPRHFGVDHGRPTWDEAGMAEELGDEDGGVALHLGAVDPLQWTGARARDACGAK